MSADKINLGKNRLYVRSMGKLLEVTAIYTSDDAANRHMERAGNSDSAVAVIDGLVLLADHYDPGLKTS